MITFLPIPENLIKNAKCLDTKRLISSINETKMALNPKGNYKKHPTTLMWENNKNYLIHYCNSLYDEYYERFKKPVVYIQYDRLSNFNAPIWYNDPLVSYSHIINLLRKNNEHYSKYFYCEEWAYPNGYFWPLCVGKKATYDSTQWKYYYMKYPERFKTIKIL